MGRTCGRSAVTRRPFFDVDILVIPRNDSEVKDTKWDSVLALLRNNENILRGRMKCFLYCGMINVQCKAG